MPAVTRRIGRRGAALLFFALLGGVYCYGLLDPAQPIGPTYAWAQSVLPLWVWAALWGTSGALCLVCAFLDRDSVAFGAMTAVTAWWGLLLGAGWLMGDVDRGYVSAVIWLALSGFVYVIGGGLPAKRSPS
jgi:hypothetical protein